MRILVFGANGQVGRATVRGLAGLGEVVALGREAADVRSAQQIGRAFAACRPHLVVNAAADTAVDAAEREPDAARRTNAEAPGMIAAACRAHGAGLVHLSTDYVFDGRKREPYVESDPPAPLSVYGRTKLDGERAVLESGAAAVVLRTAWIYGEDGDNFVLRILRAALSADRLQVVDDQTGAPTWAGRIAEVIRQIATEAVGGDPIDGRAADGGVAGGLHRDDRERILGRFAARGGLYHACAAGRTTRYGCARHALEAAARDSLLRPRLRIRPDRIEAVPSSTWPSAAPRPSNSLLDCSKLRATFGCVLPDWRDDVTAFVQRLAAAGRL